MSNDIDRAEFDEWVAEGAWERIWSAYQLACLERDDAEAYTHQEQVHEMMVALGIPLKNEDRPRVDNLNFDLLRSLVEEEAREFDAAMLDIEDALELEDEGLLLKAWAEVIDAICDIDVVIHNASNAMGIDMEPFFQEVHRSNMAKAGGPTRPDGKKLKPEGWEPPRIKEMLKEVLDVKQTDEPVG